MFAGLRPRVRILTGAGILDEFDFFVYTQNNSGSILQIRLPVNPKTGQYYVLIPDGNHGRQIVGSQTINWVAVQAGTVQQLGPGDYRIVHLLYNSNNWIMWATLTS